MAGSASLKEINMATSRRKLIYWRRTHPVASFDIAKLRSKTLARGKRFESPSDAREESRRSQALLERDRRSKAYGVYLQDCRDGYYQCDKTYCPQCARTFRHYLTGQLLRLNSEFEGEVRILVVLLETAPKGKLLKLEIKRYQHSLRKRLARAGLGEVPVIGGFEMYYRARSKEWVLHVNLAIFGGNEKALRKFEDGFPGDEIYRPVRRDDLHDDAEQLSYILKFTTYHRPHQQRGSKKAKAVPLNPAEHFELVRWMAQYEFSDHLLLFNARRRGASIELSSNAARNA
jgi:hypothetical protein